MLSPCWKAATGCNAVSPLNQLNTCPTIGSPSKNGKLEKLLELELELNGGKIIGVLELVKISSLELETITRSLELEPKLGSLPAELNSKSLELKLGSENKTLLLEPNSGSLELVGINGALEVDPNDSLELVGKLGTLLVLLKLKLEVLDGIGKGKGTDELLLNEDVELDGKKKPSSVMMY